MRRSKTITLSLLGAAALSGGCGNEANPTHPAGDTARAPVSVQPAANEVDFTWYDADGNEIPEGWTADDSGRLLPNPHPFDKQGRPWVWDEDGALIPPAAAVPVTVPVAPGMGTTQAATSTTTTGTTPHRTIYRRSPLIVPIFLGSSGGSGYRSYSPPAGTSARPGASNVRIGGFGTTGSAMHGSSAS